MAEVVSLQNKLTEKWTEQRTACVEGLQEANRQLARIAMIYGGQLPIDVLQDDIGNQGWDRYSPLGDPRSIAREGEW